MTRVATLTPGRWPVVSLDGTYDTSVFSTPRFGPTRSPFAERFQHALGPFGLQSYLLRRWDWGGFGVWRVELSSEELLEP